MKHILRLALTPIVALTICLTVQAQKDTTKKIVPVKQVIKTVDPKISQKPVTQKPATQKPATEKPATVTTPGKDIIYVKRDATGSNNGTSWINAYTNLQDALTGATAGKTIWVARGTYKPTTSLDRNANFKIKNNVSMYGGFAGTETSLAARNIAMNPTILDGDIGMAGNHNDNSYNVLYAKGVGAATVISGFIIQNANASQVTQIKVGSSGGGIYIEGSLAGTSPVFKHCTINDNRATWGGGVVITCNQVRSPDNGGGNPRFDTCRFRNNRGNNMGGAVFIDSYWQPFNPVFNGCTFDRNSSAEGGAVYHRVTMANSSPVYENCLFSYNSVTGRRGAAVANIFGTDDSRITSGEARPVYQGCIFQNNDASAFGEGMIYNGVYGRIYTIEIKNCVFETTGSASTPTRLSHTGGAFNNHSLQRGSLVLNVSNSVFNKLKCGGKGGVIHNYSRGGTSITSNFTNCLFSENLGCDGGVLYGMTEDAGSLNRNNFYNCIFWYNYFQPGRSGSCGRGEDIFLASAGTTAYLFNCLTNKSDCEVMKYGPGAMSCSGLVFATDPLFTDFTAGNFIPQSSSPVIDAGNDTYVSSITRDLRGNTRRQGTHVDIGPYEIR